MTLNIKHGELKLILYSLITFLLCKDVLALDGKDAPAKTFIAFHHVSRFHIDSLRRPFYASQKHTDFQESYLSIPGSGHQKKSAFFAMSMSALLPGTGQFYAQKGRESVIKGASFLVLEITGWMLYFHNKNLGKKFERRYEKFANNNWDVDKYLLFLETSLQNDPNFEISPGDLGRKDSGINFALLESAEDQWGTNTGVSVHHLYKNSRQQYYEMIYKYPEQFGLGWSDAINNQNTYPYTGYTRNNLTPLMIDYRGMRIKSNEYLSTARGMTGLIMINHLLSITDAVWTVKRKNREESAKLSLSMRLEQKLHQNELITFSTIRFTY